MLLCSFSNYQAVEPFCILATFELPQKWSRIQYSGIIIFRQFISTQRECLRLRPIFEEKIARIFTNCSSVHDFCRKFEEIVFKKYFLKFLQNFLEFLRKKKKIRENKKSFKNMPCFALNFEKKTFFRRYLHKSYNFCTQNDALFFVEDEVKKFKQKNIGTKFVIVVGSYVVGKERVWSHIAQTFNMKVWLEGERRKAFDLIYSDENENRVLKDHICAAREDAQLHVIPIQCINYAVRFTSTRSVDHFLKTNFVAVSDGLFAEFRGPQFVSISTHWLGKKCETSVRQSSINSR